MISFVASPTKASVLALLVHEGRFLTLPAQDADIALSGVIGNALKVGRFSGAKSSSYVFPASAGSAHPLIALIGAGPEGDLDPVQSEQIGASAYLAVKTSGEAVLSLDLRHLPVEAAARAGMGAYLAAYRFDKYLTQEKPDKKPSITSVEIVVTDPAAAQAAFAPLKAIAEGVNFTRDLVSEPANVLFPAEFARRAKALETLGLSVEVLGEAELEALGFRTLLAVGQGSTRESQVVILRWNGAANPGEAPVAFVGKGVCFDTGGISIKPADGMEDMKWDMGGAGAVIGLMHALAGRKAKVNAVGVLGLVENMPDGNAQRPGDIVVSLSGQTVEVLNTDAEGRLVLADALWYTQERFKPKFMVDLATLTGAIIVALGTDYAGLFANNDELADRLLAASKATGENLWRMPLPAQYEKQIESKAADLKNIGGRAGGSITAGLFLQRFVNKVPWAHLDIASTAWTNEVRTPVNPEGATGFGVRLLERFVADFYEDQ